MKTVVSSVAFQGPDGTVAANGRLLLSLSQNAMITSGGGQVYSNIPIVIDLDANGLIPANTQLWSNDLLTPSGTTYLANLQDKFGTRLDTLGTWSIAGASPIDLSAMTPVNQGISFSQAVLLNPSTSNQTIATGDLTLALGNLKLTAGGISAVANSTFQSLEHTLFADQFAGADMGAKINAAVSAAPATGCIIDATAFQGAQAAAATITVSKPILLKLGAVTLTVAGSPGISLTAQGAAIIGLSPMATVIITSSGTADILQCANTLNDVSSIGFRASGARTGGAAINLVANSGNTDIRHIRIDKTYNGIQCTSSTATGNCYFEDVQMGAGLSATGNWNLGIYLGNVASGTVASMHFTGIRIEGDAAFAGAAMVLLDSGVDTPLFENCEFVQGGSSNICILAQGNNSGQNPSWARFVNCVFEAGTGSQAINLQKCNDFKFTNCNIATSQTGILIGPASPGDVQDVRFLNGAIITCQQSAVAFTSSTGGIEISDCWIADTSQQTNGGFNSIAVNGACTNFILRNNRFGLTGFGSGFLPFKDIAVNNTTADNFQIVGNILNQGITDNSTSVNKFIFGNVPATTNTFFGPMSFNANVTQSTANGAQWIQGQNSELLTLSTSGTTTDTSANLLPANSIIEAVVARVTTTITTATDWKLGDGTTAGRFAAANSTMTAGATSIGTVQADQTGAPGPRQVSAAKVRVTTTGTPGAGIIRITVFYRQFVAPTS